MVWVNYTFCCWGGGGGGVSLSASCDLPNYTLNRFPKFKRYSTATYIRELSERIMELDLEITDNITGQVKVQKVECLGLMRLKSKISMLSANKVNESALVVSLA